MQKPASYQRLPHAQDCDCSVCWSRREMAKPAPSRSTPCALCRPAYARPIRTLQMGCVGGIWKPLLSDWTVEPAFICEKHTPPDRPAKWWTVAYQDSTSAPSEQFPF
ncbi:lysogeny maintenance protein PflM [Stutzerimonas stutzeri]|uniref:lysogeny maintenance protein PflM n=1 Tax=Stutzerimonas stutzeri TaxID=316 RepID=UPI0030145A02